MKNNKLITILILLISITFSAQNEYIYVHKKASSENSSASFPFSLMGPSSFSKTFTLNDKPDALNAFDLGNSHGPGEGQLWAVINDGSTSASTHDVMVLLIQGPIHPTPSKISAVMGFYLQCLNNILNFEQLIFDAKVLFRVYYLKLSNYHLIFVISQYQLIYFQ